jgi:predicted dehydrogenase
VKLGSQEVRERQIARASQKAEILTSSTSATSKSPGPGTIRLGALGAGSFTTGVLLPAIQKAGGIELIGIASASGTNAQHAARRFGATYATSDEKQILTDAQIDTVAVLTRHALHARLTVAALQNGKNVFCEKPLAITLEEVEQVQQALAEADHEIHEKGLDHEIHEKNQERGTNEKSGGNATSEKHGLQENEKRQAPLLTVGFNRRFSPMGQKLQNFLGGRSEPLVAHYRVNAGHLPLTHWLHDPAQGGGRIIGEGCHFIDFLTFLVGAPPISVSAQGLPDRGRYREDNVLITLTFADGSLGNVTYLANGDKSFSKERVEVFCAGRVAILDDFRSLELVENGQRREVRSRLRQDKGHRGEWEAFRQAITGSCQPPIPYDQLFAVTRATILAVEALRTQQTIKV